MSDRPSDFNDKAQGRGGLRAVQSQVKTVVDAAKGIPYPPFLVKPHGVCVVSGKDGDDGQPEEKSLCSYLAPVGLSLIHI